MLKRLELVGFKSFAEKTRFDFAPGVTAIVGPNGSGKSNIVDAVKWILGEQSAKSLRGGEMADVIFNGSSTRKSLGLAEVTMTFDNSRRQLAFDGDEVQLTRRVYRDGQGEYLINGTAARLKDFKEMFLGSGAGQGAYSIIEQGRVDALLVASTKDRRQIFEEAAGISRFRAKKIETIRKLEKVDGDLNRVRDILQELEKNLQKLSAQASKAQKYQEYQTKLKDLRIRVGRHEYLELVETLTYQEGVLAQLRSAVADATTQTESAEAEIAKREWDLARIEEALRVQEKKLGEARQRIAESEAFVRSGREQEANLDGEILRLAQQRWAMSQRIQTLEVEIQRVRDEAQSASETVHAEQDRADAVASALQSVTTTIAEWSKRSAEDRERQFALVGRAAQYQSSAEMNSSQLERLRRELTRKTAESERFGAEAAALTQVLDGLSRSDADVQQKLQSVRESLSRDRQAQDELRHQADALQPELDSLRERRSALTGRIEVLANLEQTLEGIGAGVRAVLADEMQDGVKGLVADLLTVPREIALLIELALGERAQQIVVAEDVFDQVLERMNHLPGRVSFLPLRSTVPEVDPRSAANQVQCAIPGLSEQLLGDVFLVESRDEARLLIRTHPQARCVTLYGELLEPDGSITLGPLHSDTGIVSRKSELRELNQQIQEILQRIATRETEQSKLRVEADRFDPPIRGYETEIETLSGEAGTLRDRILEQRQRRDRLVEQAELATSEAAILTKEVTKAESAWQEAKKRAEESEAEAEAIKLRLAETDQQIREAEQNREARQAESTAAQVALTRVKEQFTRLQSRLAELETEIKQRKIDGINLKSTERSSIDKRLQCQLAVLRATQRASEAYGDLQSREAAISEANERRKVSRMQRDQIQDELRAIRDAWKQRQDQAHAHELTVRDLINRRTTIVDRIREDYGIELSDLESHEQIEGLVEEWQDEIDELKRKITKLGSVNLEALEQLTEAEQREQATRREYDDLVAAEKSLLEIIEKINTDSRKLFAETLKTVTVHFQELFRKLFGGGMADIVLEDPNDILETGIEITARPPGKELRSISLLSGGEKTLTAIALLLAIFRSRPSPFCLLDEVDAALDEANTGRLADIIKEFREKSQFIIVTHKKRTMAMADVLHGVTMQESGVSKQVATRIEDWPEEPQAA